MIDKEKDKYRDLFISEGREHLDSLDASMIGFEKDTKNTEIAEELMRHAHTLKGMAAEMGYGSIGNLAHSFEGMVENVKNDVSGHNVDILFGAIDELRSLIDQVENGLEPSAANPLIDQVGELEQVDKVKDKNTIKSPESFHSVQEVKVKIEKLDMMVDLAAELLINKLRLEDAIDKNLPEKKVEINAAIDEHSRLISDLQYKVLQLRLTPLMYVFNRFPRMVRDLSKTLKKEVEFKVSGGGIEIDRDILENIGEPLIHILRNAIDHGIDKSGVLELKAERVNNYVFIKIKDNGSGIDWAKLRQKAGITGTSHEENVEALFSGNSTAEHVTEVSGRGVGLSVVRKKIEELGGTVDVQSEPGKGTEFILRLPISIAIIQAVIATVAGSRYAIPASDITRLVSMSEITKASQVGQKVVVVNEKEVPLISLRELFNVTSETDGVTRDKVLVLSDISRERLGFLVDTISEQRDIIVKPYTLGLKSGKMFTSMTLLGDGSPIPIINLHSIMDQQK